MLLEENLLMIIQYLALNPMWASIDLLCHYILFWEFFGIKWFFLTWTISLSWYLFRTDLFMFFFKIVNTVFCILGEKRLKNDLIRLFFDKRIVISWKKSIYYGKRWVLVDIYNIYIVLLLLKGSKII